MNAQPDSVLCRLAARGNSSAYDAIYQRYRQPVYAFVFHLLGRANGDEDAEDITQDVFTRAFAGIREQRVDGGFRSWLFTIARNRTFDEIRGGAQKVVSLDADNAEPPEAPQAHEPAERAEQRAEFAWLMSAVAELPERQREALLMREMGGFSHERIAKELGTSVSATKKLISRGRDGIGVAAASVGYDRFSKRRLGRDLAMAAPIVPISITFASLGVTGGAAAGGALAGGGAVLGGKTAATALTLLAIGGGAVAVEHDASKGRKAQSTAVQEPAIAGPVQTERVANGAAGVRRELPFGVADDRRERGRGEDAEDRQGKRDDDSRRGQGPEDRDGQEDSRRRGSSRSPQGEDGREVDQRGDDRSGRGRGGEREPSRSGSGEAIEGEDPPPQPEFGDDGSQQSAEGPDGGGGEAPEADEVSDESLGD